MNIIITGNSKGIGLEITKLFCRDLNNNVIGISRTANSDLSFIELGENTHFYPISYNLENIKTDFLNLILEKFQTIDIVINNAGYLVNKTFEHLNDNDFEKTFNVNVKSIFKITQILLPYFTKNSHIVNISSMGGFQGSAKFKGLSLYSASKGAVNILTECLAEELMDYHIKVNSLSLGAVNTEMLREAFPGYQAPLQAKEMAEFIKNFAENAHHYLNGKIIPVSLSTP